MKTAHWRNAGRREEKYPELCSNEFTRALESFVLAECHLDGLDSDDIAFLERFRTPWGLWNDTGRNPVCAGEQDFWSAPYGVEPGVTRKLGTATVIPAERRLARQKHDEARQERLRAPKAQREAASAEERAELAREQAAWDMEQERLAKERERRLTETMKADIEWEKSWLLELDDSGAPLQSADFERPRPRRVEYKTSNNSRFYVPQWKRDIEEQFERDLAEQELVEKWRAKWDAIAKQRTNMHHQAAEEAAAQALATQRAKAKEAAAIAFAEEHDRWMAATTALAAQQEHDRRMTAVRALEARALTQQERDRQAEYREYDGDWMGFGPAEVAELMRKVKPDSNIIDIARECNIEMERLSRALMQFYETYGDHSQRFTRIKDYRLRRNAYFIDALNRFDSRFGRWSNGFRAGYAK
jgi:hypothetical protein